MTARIKNCGSSFGLTFLVLFAALFWAVGCAAPKPVLDPLAGWHFCLSQDPKDLGEAIMADYQDYIQKLPSEERNYIGPVHTFEDGTGQHAVNITIALNGTDWAHVLIYDKENKRMKVIKYVSGHYRS